ncbi:dynamin family protein [Actinocorallia longicatena]|uniref:50S ribosome-binding GTPase n=1 Tax=Actinocorallia longicatena TaxID=111803 RepID=A0ABP6QL52_9ACTN
MSSESEPAWDRGLPAADGIISACERAALSGGPPLAPLAAAVAAARTKLGQPMRLAVAGQIKRGKSTIVNALLGADLAATGPAELTFTVNEFHDARTPRIMVHYRNGDSEEFPPEQLHALTVRDAADVERLRRIRRVEYGLPNPLLEKFRLIDTPGLASVHAQDSANAMDALGISGFTSETERADIGSALKAMDRTAEEVGTDSAAELDAADAVLYLFSRGLHERDSAALTDFLGPSAASLTPLKAFGVLSKCDQYWPPGAGGSGPSDPMTYDPLAEGARLAQRCMERPENRRLFFTLVPVSGLVALAAQTLGPEEFGWLEELARADQRWLADELGDAGYFASEERLPRIPLGRAERSVLIRRLGPWGVHLAARHLRDGLGEAEVRERLVRDSGVARLRELVVGHFGARATLIKLDHGLRGVSREVTRCRGEAFANGVEAPEQAGRVAGLVQWLRAQEPGFDELHVLGDHYNGRLRLTDAEVADLLTVTGEYGGGTAARLGLPAGASPDDQLRTARDKAGAWARRERDPMLDRHTRNAAEVLRRAYELLAHLTGGNR